MRRDKRSKNRKMEKNGKSLAEKESEKASQPSVLQSDAFYRSICLRFTYLGIVPLIAKFHLFDAHLYILFSPWIAFVWVSTCWRWKGRQTNGQTDMHNLIQRYGSPSRNSREKVEKQKREKGGSERQKEVERQLPLLAVQGKGLAIG